MPQYKTFSGTQCIQIFESFGFKVLSQRGSHVKLRRIKKSSKQTLVIPNHKELDRGTVHAVFRQAIKYIPETELFPFFSIKR